MKYLLAKLIEEAGEVVVAACKYRLHRNEHTKRQLEHELGDLFAIVALLKQHYGLDGERIATRKAQRKERERKRCQLSD